MHLLHYHDERFLKDQMFSLFVFDSIERHENNGQGSYFFNSGKFLGQNPPTIEEIKEQWESGDDRYIQMLRYYSRNIKGSDNYWRSKTQELEGSIQHHVLRGRGHQHFSSLFPVQRTGGLTSDEFWLSLSVMQVMNWLHNCWRVLISKP